MKHILHTRALMGLVMMLAAAVVVACQKDPLDEFNPKAETIAEAGFSLKGKETRSDGTYVLPWTISKSGVMDSELEELDELAITPFNTFTLEAVPDNASGFPDINAKTDNACIKLERVGQNSFSISYVSDGDATIRVWNGGEGGNTTVTFKVQARKTIPVEGLLVRIDDEEEVLIKAVGSSYSVIYDKQKANPFYDVKYLYRKEGSQTNDGNLEDIYRPYDKEELNLHKLEILHIQPENTTYRRLNYTTIAFGHSGTVSKMFCPGEYDWWGGEYKVPNGTDVSILYGKSIFFCSKPKVKPDIVMIDHCPPGEYYLMQTAAATGSDINKAGNIWALANGVKVVE